MAYVALANIFDPEILADQLSAKFPDMLVLGNTNLVQLDSTVPMGSPGSHFKMPFWKRISPFTAMTEGTPLTTNSMSYGLEQAIVQRAGVAFEVLNTAELVSKADPVSEIADQMARRAAEYLDASLVTVLSNTPNVYSQVAATVTQNDIAKALLTLGDNSALLRNGGQIIMHSKPYTDLLTTGAIQNQYQSGMDVIRTGVIPTLMGLPIHVSDLVPVVNVGTSGAPVYNYHNFIVGPGALALFYQRAVMVEFDRDILLQADLIAATVHFAPHLWGYDDATSAVVAEQTKSIHAIEVVTQ